MGELVGGLVWFVCVVGLKGSVNWCVWGFSCVVCVLGCVVGSGLGGRFWLLCVVVVVVCCRFMLLVVCWIVVC